MLNKSAQAYTKTRTADAYGGRSHTLTADGNTFACCLQLARANDIIARGAQGVALTHRMYCLPRTLGIGQVVEIDSMQYEVVFANDVQGREKVMQVDLRRIEGGGS